MAILFYYRKRYTQNVYNKYLYLIVETYRYIERKMLA